MSRVPLGILLTCGGFFLLAPPLTAQELERSRVDSVPRDEWLAADKAAHAFGGFWSAGAGYAVAGRLDAEGEGRRVAAITAGLAAGFAKEAFDRWVQRERFSWKDLAADLVGVALLVAVTAAAES